MYCYRPYQISIWPEPDPTLGYQEDRELSSKENLRQVGNLRRRLLKIRNLSHIASVVLHEERRLCIRFYYSLSRT